MPATDPRSSLAAAQQWVCDLVAALDPGQLSLPTPCAEFDVAGLVSHLFGVELRTLAYATDHHVGTTPSTVALTSADPARLADELRALVERSTQAWAAWDPADLGSTMITAPFGTVPAAAAVAIMTSENLVHGWDLAVASGQPCETLPEVCDALIGAMGRALPPAGARGVDIPFDDPVTPAPDAGPTERLANFVGHRRP